MRAPRRLLIGLGILVGVPVLAGLLFDSNWLKGPVERAVSERFGRDFRIGGDFDIVPRWPPRFVMERVTLVNPPWAAGHHTLQLERAEFSLALPPLLRGNVVLPEVTLTGPVIDLERNADGVDNWTLAPDPEKSADDTASTPVIGRLTVDRGVLTFRDAAPDTAVTVQVETTDGGQRGLRFQAAGKYAGKDVEAGGTGGPMLSLADTTLPYPFDVTFAVGATSGTAKGTITGLATLAAADVQVAVQGESASDLYGLIGVAIPPTPPYHVSGQLIREAGWWRFHKLRGKVGDSDISGDADVAYETGGRVRLQARLESQLLDLDDIGGFVGAKPQVGPGETASKDQAREAAAEEADPKLLPDMPIKLDRLRAMDADVEFTGKAIRGKTPVDDLKTHLVLKDGQLTAKPLDFGVAGGSIVSTLTLDGRSDKAGVDASIEFKRLDLKKLFPGNSVVAKATGLVGGRAKLQGKGNSLAEVLADADGTLGLASSGGRISNLVIELAGLDVAEVLKLLFRGDKAVRVRCAIADVAVQDGVIDSRTVFIDTTDTNLKIEGQVSLASEELDLTLHPLPKDYSPLTLRSPLHLRGTFKDPKVRPDAELAVRGGLAAILGGVAPPLAALVGLIESGPGDDADCERLIAAVQRHAPEPSAAAPRPPSRPRS